ncbi:TonB-dependent receptor plug domain-containing protein [Mangrovibacterium diazotrophicum]|uniref:Outer membrane receptor protein involved in Fe transport n=1 Tax=Mangrovibacterium diazotrophicum TaxID=1261403 RepID=A0A419VYM6_9BACT|nr:TonB-dependent receptor plug domain-containing protein [Mangrovibacterium diazotrophicum]RKD88264.1 outer membrane receptor protein involved in Fe transport [Mangrovibacterium diazotrophicum]
MTVFQLAGTISSKAQQAVVMDSTSWTNRSGLENVLQGKVSGLNIKSWTGTPGMQSIMNLRGLSIDPTDESTMPLVMIDGVPIISSPSEITAINPLSYFSPEQVERIEIIKDIDRLAALGVQAPNGAINIVMKAGKTGPLHVLASGFAGVNFTGDFDYKKDAFYGFNTMARREVYKQSLLHEQNLLIDGGGSYGSYLFGVNSHHDEGIIDDTKSERQSLFLNAKYNITDKFTTKFYNNLTLAGRDGRYAGEYNRELDLPVIDSERFFMDKKRNVALLSSLDLNYRFSSALSLKSLVGVSYESARRDLYIPSNILDGSIFAYSAAYKRQLMTINTSLNYQIDLGNSSELDMTIGNEIRTVDNRLTSVDGQRSMEDGGSDFVKVVTGYNASQTDAFSEHVQNRLVSYYGTWNLKAFEDLNARLVLRADGSSLYDSKWALYPALGIDYQLNHSLGLPLKVNLAVGKTGALASEEVYQGELAAYGDYYGGTELGVGTLYRPFKDAKSVDITQFDAGLTYEVARALSVSVKYFSKNYQDFTYLRYLPNISGVDYQYETGAELGLSGIEFDLQAKLVNSDSFGWDLNLNLTSSKNKVIGLPDDIERTSLSQYSQLENDDALTSFIALENGQPVKIGDSAPDVWGGFANTFRYKQLSASVLFTYSLGADVVAESFDSRYSEDLIGDDFPVKEAETPYYFTETDDDGNVTYQGIKSIEDASYLRLSSATVAYDFSSLFENSMVISSMKVFVRGDNLVTLTKYSGSNPDENITGIRRYNLAYTGTPLPLSVVLGLKVQF